MTKQEQNEKIVYGSLITSTKCYNCIHFPLCFEQKGAANLELASENDCCYYQSKLPKDSVVLSREEYERLKRVENEKDRLYEIKLDLENQLIEKGWTDYEGADEIEKRVSKETAEKLLNDFKLWAREYQYKDTVVDENGERPMTNNEKLNYLYTYLCDKYKVEIKEYDK